MDVKLYNPLLETGLSGSVGHEMNCIKRTSFQDLMAPSVIVRSPASKPFVFGYQCCYAATY